MYQETFQAHIGGGGDLSNTMIAWVNKVTGILGTRETAMVKDGQNVSRRTNTLNNHGTPHGANPNFPNDPTDRANSERFGGYVIDYIRSRGKDFIQGMLVPGRSEQRESHSTYQVLTTLKGFGQPSLEHPEQRG